MIVVPDFLVRQRVSTGAYRPRRQRLGSARRPPGMNGPATYVAPVQGTMQRYSVIVDPEKILRQRLISSKSETGAAVEGGLPERKVNLTIHDHNPFRISRGRGLHPGEASRPLPHDDE